mmetsp:Transcript_3507/g.9329  ORF Transcript_3507/g.9329 Transcript_3507/m.9329 type:complete len:126 (-) Transcript_3507:97-474(-)
MDAWHAKVCGACYGAIGSVWLFAPHIPMKDTFPGLKADQRLPVKQIMEACGMGFATCGAAVLAAAFTTPKESYTALCKGLFLSSLIPALGVLWHSSKSEYGPVPAAAQAAVVGTSVVMALGAFGK